MSEQAAKVVLHLPGRSIDSYTERPHLRLFEAIRSTIETRGGTIEVRRRDEALRDPNRQDWSDILEPQNLHIIENGTVHQTNALNTTLSYIPPYYHLDPNGVLANSRAYDAQFDAGAIPALPATIFFTRLHDRLVRSRRSRYSPKREVTDLPEGCIAVFLQGDYPDAQGTAFCDSETLLRTVSKHAGNRSVVVKAHPSSNIRAESELIYRLLKEGLPLQPTDANIHDILAKCVVSVSFNSAVSVEGFLHQKPTLLFGKSDFHHVSHTVQSPEDFPAQLNRALNSSFDYEKFLYWYFNTFCLSVEDPAVEQKILDRFSQAGFDTQRLGLEQQGHMDWTTKLSAQKHASEDVQSILRLCPEIQEADLRRVLKLSPTSQVFLGRVNGEKVVVKRFLTEDCAHTVSSLKGELDYLETVFGDGPHQANRCLMAWPDLGLVVLSHAPGKRLEEKIAQSKGPMRARLFRQSGEWLAHYTQSRRRETTFGPGFWVKRLAKKPLDHITAPEDRALLDRLKGALWKLNERVKGCAVIQAATHGDFVGINAHFHKGVIYGVDIQGECWLAIARETARFLVWQQLHDPATSPLTSFGINQDDWQAFVASGLLSPDEQATTLPFFVGEQLYGRFVEDYDTALIRSEGRTAIKAFLKDAKAMVNAVPD